MSTLFVGDVHGKTQDLVRICEQHGAEDVFQVGDMGLGFSGVKLPALPNLTFIRGNHDDPKACKEHPNYAGDFGYFGHKELFFLGGGWSIDHSMRTPGVSWWPDEQLSDDQLEEAYRLYKETHPLYVVSHEAPAEAGKQMMERIVTVGKALYFGGNTGKYIPTRTSQALQRMFETHQPKRWFFGHYHLNHELELGYYGYTKFRCLDELSVFPLDTRE